MKLALATLATLVAPCGASVCQHAYKDPQQCSCLEWFGIDADSHVDLEEVKQGFRAFSRHFYPTKFRGDPADGEAIFAFGGVCKEFLNHSNRIKKYTKRVVELMAEKDAGKMHRKMADYNNLQIKWLQGSMGHVKEDLVTERLHVFLDDSLSMKEKWLSEAKERLLDIMPRLERTPSTVHLIRSRENSKLIFAAADAAPDAVPQSEPLDLYKYITSDWSADARSTYLWQYIHDVLCGKFHSDDTEVVIFTDGLDNVSEGAFRGAHGYNHMMKELKKCNKVLPRITVMCLGSHECRSHYQEATEPSGGQVFVSTSTSGDGSEGFREHMLLPHGTRMHQALLTMQKYEMIKGPEERVPWFDGAMVLHRNLSDL